MRGPESPANVLFCRAFARAISSYPGLDLPSWGHVLGHASPAGQTTVQNHVARSPGDSEARSEQNVSRFRRAARMLPSTRTTPRVGACRERGRPTLSELAR